MPVSVMKLRFESPKTDFSLRFTQAKFENNLTTSAQVTMDESEYLENQ